jgi:hypothetical protein
MTANATSQANIPETLPGKGQVSLGAIWVAGTVKEYFAVVESEEHPGYYDVFHYDHSGVLSSLRKPARASMVEMFLTHYTRRTYVLPIEWVTINWTALPASPSLKRIFTPAAMEQIFYSQEEKP